MNKVENVSAVASSMPGASGFTLACFSADKVPAGTLVYAYPNGTNLSAEVRKVISDLIDHAQSMTCAHENTYRGGAIWEICGDCGCKWADDEGGKPEFVEHSSITAAQKLIDRSGL